MPLKPCTMRFTANEANEALRRLAANEERTERQDDIAAWIGYYEGYFAKHDPDAVQLMADTLGVETSGLTLREVTLKILLNNMAKE